MNSPTGRQAGIAHLRARSICGGRGALPIRADIVAKVISIGPQDRVDVLVQELDGRDAVELVRES